MGKVYFCRAGHAPDTDNPDAERAAAALVAVLKLEPRHREDTVAPDGIPDTGVRTRAGDIADPRHVLVLLERGEAMPPLYQPPNRAHTVPWSPGWYHADMSYKAARQALGLSDI